MESNEVKITRDVIRDKLHEIDLEKDEDELGSKEKKTDDRETKDIEMTEFSEEQTSGIRNRNRLTQQHVFNRLEGDDREFPPPPPPVPSETMPHVKTANFGMLLRQLKTQDMYGAESARKRLKLRVKKLRTLDRVASIIAVLQCFVITLTASLAAMAAETAWIAGGNENFVPTQWTTFLQSLTMLFSVASLVIFYIESRVEVIMRYPQKRWFWPWYFPSVVEACFEAVLYALHCPPMIFDVPLIVCTSLRVIFLFRLCKFHPDVVSIRFNQIMTGECPSFSAFFFYKTIVRTSPLVAILFLAVLTTPIILFIYLQTSRLDERFADNPESPLEVLWKIVWFVIAQQSPDALPSARVSAILAAIVSMALSTMIFTGLLGSLEMDSAQSAQYELVYRKQVLDDVRNLAAKTIQNAFRYSRSKNPKGKKHLKKTLKAFRAKLAIHTELKEKDRNGGSVVHSLSHLISTTEELTQRLDRLKFVVEGKHAALYNLDTNLHSQTLANLSLHFQGLLAKLDESSSRFETAQTGASASLSSLQRDLHDVAVENMRALQARQEEYQKSNFSEMNRATEYLVKLTSTMAQVTSRQAEDRENLQQQFSQLQQQLQNTQTAALQDIVLKLRASQLKGAEELQAALRKGMEQSREQLLQQLQHSDATQQTTQKSILDLGTSVQTSQQKVVDRLQQSLLEHFQTTQRKNTEDLQRLQAQKSEELQQLLQKKMDGVQTAMQQGLIDLWGKLQISQQKHADDYHTALQRTARRSVPEPRTAASPPPPPTNPSSRSRSPAPPPPR